MATLNITKTYANGSVLTQTDLDNICNSVETIINVTKLNDDNIQDSGITASTKVVNASITGNKLNPSVADAVSIELYSTQLRLKDAGITTAKFAANAVDAAALSKDASDDSKRAVTTNSIKDAAVTGAKIAANTITASNLAASAVTNGLLQTFNSSSTWTAPGNVNWVDVEMWGAGGGGGGGGSAPGVGSQAGGSGGGGGSSGCYRREKIHVTPGTTYTITVGTGGAGGGSNANGSNGGDTSFDTIITTSGGVGGGGGHQSNSGPAAGGIGGGPQGYTLWPMYRFGGGAGGSNSGTASPQAGSAGDSNTYASGGAGASAFADPGLGDYSGGGGGGAAGWVQSATGGAGGLGPFGPGTAPSVANSGAGGGGGSGGVQFSATGKAGGAGADGRLIIYWVGV